ncbi:MULTISPECIES: hypothetical protein [unclassified Cupriavidus]|jgi:hypothetical protein|uniref:hypothetical protein n=1 Tax=unclassified Cupriavidus TaxID=2640874 RepID=UPI00313C9807
MVASIAELTTGIITIYCVTANPRIGLCPRNEECPHFKLRTELSRGMRVARYFRRSDADGAEDAEFSHRHSVPDS